MTTPTPQTDRITAAEIRELFADLRAEVDDIRRAMIVQNEIIIGMRDGLQQAASQPAPQVGTFAEMIVDCIIMTYDDNGKPAYKATGAPYQKFGVRVWDEIIPQFVDVATLKPGKNPISPTPARVLMNTPEEGKTAQPRKITGKV